MFTGFRAIAFFAGLPWVWGFPWAWVWDGMGTVINAHGSVGILWGFFNGREIKRNTSNMTVINVGVDFEFYQKK